MGKRVSKNDIRKVPMAKIIYDMAGKYNAYEIFMDWITCFAISISNSLGMIHDEVWNEREEHYLQIMKKYNEKERAKFGELVAMLIEELENDPRDVLGECFMSSGMGSDAGGQFFTPYHVSQLLANLDLEEYTNGEPVTLAEPSCGSGGSIIAAAMALKEKGINYQKTMKVVAQDLDWKCVHMCYVQCSLLGIDAICVQGDTLIKPYIKGYPRRQIMRTPANVGALI